MKILILAETKSPTSAQRQKMEREGFTIIAHGIPPRLRDEVTEDMLPHWYKVPDPVVEEKPTMEDVFNAMLAEWQPSTVQGQALKERYLSKE